MLNIIVEQITSLGDGVLMIGSLAYILGVRKGKSKYLVLFMLLQYLCAQYLIQLPVQQFILGIAVNIGMCYVCLKESWRSWCLWSIIIMILYIVSSSVCFPVISLVTGEPMSVLITGNIFTRICSILIARLLLVILIWAAMIQRKNRVYLKWQEWLLILLILIAAAFILISLLEINLNTGIYGKEQGHILGIFTLQLVILGCCTFLALHISKMNQRMNEGKIVAIQLDKQKAMIEKAYQMQRETRILSHDLKHYAMAWTKLLEEGNVEQAKKQMAGFTGAVSSIGVNVYYIVDNEMLNAVMYEKDPSSYPDPSNIVKQEEPFVDVHLYTPNDYVGGLMDLCQNKRGALIDMKYLDDVRVDLHYAMPLGEIVYDFFDAIKSRSRGYASYDYEFKEYRESDLVKLDFLLNGDPVDALSMIVFRDNAYAKGRRICEKLRDNIPRNLFEIPVQAAIGGKIIARETVKAMRKDVLAKCYGGDITRKKKLLEKQKEGKKKMRQLGSVSLPSEAFTAVLKLDSDDD